MLRLSKLGPVVHVLAGLIPLAWYHVVINDGNINAVPNLGLIAFCAVLALLPDIDTHSSILGRFVPEISRAIERHYGHRSITHSLAANGLVGGLAYLLAPDWIPLTLAYSSHLIIDMIVGGNAGVPLLWPAPWRFKLMHVVPATRGELVVGAVALALLILPFTAPAAASEVRSVIPQPPTPTPTKTTRPPTPTSTPAPTLVAIRIDNVFDIETEILVQVGDVITVGQPVADLHILRTQLLNPATPTPKPTPITVAAIQRRSGLAEKSYRVATINTQVINLRRGPGLEHGIITTASRGQTFEVIDEQGGWVQIQHNGSSAWLFGELVTLSDAGTIAEPPPQVDPLKLAGAYADLELARAVATKAFRPPEPEAIEQVCGQVIDGQSQLENMRNTLWTRQLSRDSQVVESDLNWLQQKALEAPLLEMERQIAAYEQQLIQYQLDCDAIRAKPYALDDFDREIAAARLQQAEIIYMQRVATPTPKPTITATPTVTPSPTPTAAPLPDFSDTYVASLVGGDVHAINVARVDGNKATIEIQIATGYGIPPSAPAAAASTGGGTVAASGSISAAFTHNGVDIEQMLIDRIAAATATIDVSAFEFNLDRVADALIEAHQRGVAVRWVTDDEYGLHEDSEPGHGQFERLQASGIEVRDDGRSALMHNKFWIFDAGTDNASVWTGSMNITVNGTTKNNNNVILFDSPAVAEVYQAEFDEMWAGQFGPDSPSMVGGRALELDGVPVEVWFGPEDGVAARLTDLILDAQESIRFMAFSFTHDDMGLAMQQKAAELGNVQGIFESRGSGTEYSELSRLHCESIADVRKDGNGAAFHHKVIVIDELITVTGSFNFSANANERNDENLVIVWDEEIALAYLAEFGRRWGEAGEVTDACP